MIDTHVFVVIATALIGWLALGMLGHYLAVLYECKAPVAVQVVHAHVEAMTFTNATLIPCTLQSIAKRRLVEHQLLGPIFLCSVLYTLQKNGLTLNARWKTASVMRVHQFMLNATHSEVETLLGVLEDQGRINGSKLLHSKKQAVTDLMGYQWNQLLQAKGKA